jgi:hypothetical protein
MDNIDDQTVSDIGYFENTGSGGYQSDKNIINTYNGIIADIETETADYGVIT